MGTSEVVFRLSTNLCVCLCTSTYMFVRNRDFTEQGYFCLTFSNGCLKVKNCFEGQC